MKAFEIIQSVGAGNGYIAHYQNDVGGKASDYVMHVVAGIVPPIAFIPGYYLVLGIMFTQTPGGLYKILFMEEKEDSSQTRLIDALLDSAGKLCLEYIYADRDGKAGFFTNLHNEANRKAVRWRLMPAPCAEDVLYGMALINEYAKEKAFNRPDDSLLVTKMSIDGQPDISEVKALLDSPNQYVFHVLRYILAGIQRDIMPTAKPGNVYDLQANRFYNPNSRQRQSTERGFYV